jgi:hypothetical protein
VPKGTKIRVDARFDNSVNNKYNPNSSRDVFFGEQTWEEMMTGYVGVLVDDATVDPRQLKLYEPAPRGSRFQAAR